MESRARARVAERESRVIGGEKLPTHNGVQRHRATASPESVIKGHNITRTSHNTTKNHGSSHACKHALSAVESVRLPTPLP